MNEMDMIAGQPSPAPEGQPAAQPGAEGMSPTPDMGQEPQPGADDAAIRQNVLEHIASLSDEQKNWIQANLSPETWAMLTLITGRAVGEALRPFVDESIILVPMDRAEYDSLRQQEQGQNPAAAGTPQASPQPEQQSQATAQPSAPVQQQAPAATLS